MKAVAERNSNTVLVQIDPDPSGETPFDQTRGVIVDMRRRTVSEPAYVQSILQRGYWTPFSGDEDDVLSIVGSITAAGRFDETKHRRWPKGTRERGREGGGRFAPKEATSAQSDEKEPSETDLARPDWLGSSATTTLEAYDKARRKREAIDTARGWLEENGHTESAQGVPLKLLNHVGIVEMMNKHYPDGYEYFLSMEFGDSGMHVDDFRTNWRRNGEYVPERELEHNEIQTRFMEAGEQPPSGTKPTAIFMAGGSGSGKGSLLGKQVKGKDGIWRFEGGEDIGAPEGAVYVNPDDIKEMFPETQILRAANDRRWATLSHEESSDVAGKLWTQAEKAGFPVAIDGTGDAAPEKFLNKIRRAEANGYEARVVFVDIPTDEAVKRAQIREQQTGRKVATQGIIDIHKNVTQRHLEWRDQVDNWEVWANDDPEGGGRRVIARRVKGGKIEVLDKKRYDQMLEKANG